MALPFLLPLPIRLPFHKCADKVRPCALHDLSKGFIRLHFRVPLQQGKTQSRDPLAKILRYHVYPPWRAPKASHRGHLQKVLDILCMVCYNTIYMNEHSNPSLSLPLVFPGYHRCSGRVGGRFDKPLAPVHNLLTMVFLTHQPLFRAKGCASGPPRAEVGIARGSSSSGEKRSKTVQNSPISDPQKGIIPLSHAGKRALTPTFPPHAPKGPFPGRKSHEIARRSTVSGSFSTIIKILLT